MRPDPGFVIERCATGSVVALFNGRILKSQKRLNDAGAGWLGGGKDELRPIDTAAVIRTGQIHDRGVGSGT